MVGQVIDIVKYLERSRTIQNESNQTDGYYLETNPPFITVKHYENGVVRKEFRVMSEHMLRELLESLP
jgi:hypothetical protein